VAGCDVPDAQIVEIDAKYLSRDGVANIIERAARAAGYAAANRVRCGSGW
jgi:hypothetical protein